VGLAPIAAIGESLFHRKPHYVNLFMLIDADGARQLIRQRIQTGHLPRGGRTIEVWRGPGFEQTCDGCGRTITHAHTMRLICADDWRAVRLHDDCFLLWEDERRTAAIARTA
jgi:hypothetical protein